MTDTITLPRSVVEQALEALNLSMPHNNDMDHDWPSHIAARRALRAALEQRCPCGASRQEQIDECAYLNCAALEQPQVEQGPNPRWPSNASEVRAFLSGRVATERYARDDHQPDDNDTYTLSAHDLLEAIDWWTDFDTQPRQPLTDEWIRMIYDECDAETGDEFIFAFARAIERAHGIGGEA